MFSQESLRPLRSHLVRLFTVFGLAALTACTPVTAPAPERFLFAVDLPEVSPLAQTSSTQRQGGIAITVAAARFDTVGRVECTYDFPRLGFLEVTPEGVTTKTHQEFSEASRVVMGLRAVGAKRADAGPPALTFLVTIRNGMSRVFRGAGALVEFRVDNHVEAVEKSSYTEFLDALLPPGSETQLAIAGPPLGSLPDGSTLGVFLYDVVTAMDAAGTVTKRENFEWYYRVNRRRLTGTTSSVTRNVWVPGDQVARIAQLMPNQQQRLIPNRQCMPGAVAARGAGPRADALGSLVDMSSNSTSTLTSAPSTSSVAATSAPSNSAMADPRPASPHTIGIEDSSAALDAEVRSHPFRPDFTRSLVRRYLRDSAFAQAIPPARRLVADEPLSAEAYQSLATAFRNGTQAGSAGGSPSKSLPTTSDSAKKYEALLKALPADVALDGFKTTASSAECSMTITNRSARIRSFTLILQYLDRRGSIVVVDTVKALDLAAGSTRTLRSSRRATGVVGYRYRGS
jgi:hypothetical protein